MARDAFAEAAVERAVLERGHDGVILLQLVEERRVDARQVARIDERGVDALPGQQLADAVALLVEVAGGDEGHAAAAVTDAEGVERGVIRVDRLSGVVNLTLGHADGYGELVLPDGPGLHGHELLVGGGGEVDEVGDVAEHGDVEEADVREVVHAEDRGAEHVDDGRITVHAEVLRDLVVGALQEGGVGEVDRPCAAFGHARGEGHGLLFGDADVDVLRAGLPTAVGGEAEAHRHGGRYDDELRVALHLLAEEVAKQAGHVFALVARAG